MTSDESIRAGRIITHALMPNIPDESSDAYRKLFRDVVRSIEHDIDSESLECLLTLVKQPLATYQAIILKLAVTKWTHDIKIISQYISIFDQDSYSLPYSALMSIMRRVQKGDLCGDLASTDEERVAAAHAIAALQAQMVSSSLQVIVGGYAHVIEVYVQHPQKAKMLVDYAFSRKLDYSNPYDVDLLRSVAESDASALNAGIL